MTDTQGSSIPGNDTRWVLTEFLNSFDSITRTPSLRDKLDLVCRSIVNARLYQRALIAFYEKRQRDMCLVEIGSAGIKSEEIQRIRDNFKPVREEEWLRKFQPRFQLGRSYFIPAEVGFDDSPTTSIDSEKLPEEFKGGWHPDDRLFIPLHNLSGDIIGILSVDDPFDERRPTGESLNLLELYSNLVSAVINEFMLLGQQYQTMRQRAEQATQRLTESQEKYRLIAENIGELVYVQSLDGAYEFVSPSVERLLGYSPEEYRNVADTIWAENSEMNRHARTIRELVFRNQFKGIPVYYLELLCKDGRKVIHEIREEIIQRENGEPAILGVARDVTERFRMEKVQKEMEIELLTLSKMSSIGMLASGFGHNLNSPLQAIRGYTEILLRKHPEMAELKLILRGAEKMSDIISNLMTKARQEQDRSTRPVNLNVLLEQELIFLEADLEYKRSVEKDFRFSPEPLEIVGIYSDFSQSLSAIINNALDSMWNRDKKRLSVSTSLQDGWIQIEITDTGCGIDPKNLDRIFQPFFSTKPVLTDRKGSEPVGTGLGLSTAQQLLGKYGAKVEVKSVVDQGTTFLIRIPRNATLDPSCTLDAQLAETSWCLSSPSHI